jgi:hypothetical protein
MGRLIVSVSKHYTAVIDSVLYDTHDPTEVKADASMATGRCDPSPTTAT